MRWFVWMYELVIAWLLLLAMCVVFELCSHFLENLFVQAAVFTPSFVSDDLCFVK